jgi:folate-binding protein YgfZ
LSPTVASPMIASERPAFFDLSARVKLRVSGADAFRFLNGQVTNNLAKATATGAIQASILNAKGKLAAHVFISKADDTAFFLDADPELRDELPARLDRYIIADDVRLEDVTEKFSIFHLMAESQATAPESTRAVAANRFGSAGSDLWVERDEAEKIRQRLAGTFVACDDACSEVLRIERGIPRWGRELTSEIIPVEANLEESSIDYAKGCYIGQEVVSRMKMSGQRNKSLCGLLSLSGAPLPLDARLTPESEPTKDAGWVTSAIRSERLGKEIGLGFVKRGYNTAGTRLQAGEISVEVAELPFV